MNENIFKHKDFNLYHDCVGCGNCSLACNYNAIKFLQNNEGFLYPNLQSDKCINCALCVSVCPAINQISLNSNRPKCYAFQADDNLRKDKSSSGGVFGTLAQDFINKGYYVCGAVFDSSFKLVHCVSDSNNAVYKMRGSKYLQSWLDNCFIEIKDKLNVGNKVLFTGTPCQVAALKKFLHHDYCNLYCIDLVCHGVASPAFFDRYNNEELRIKDVNSINFRDKNFEGWKDSYFTGIGKDNLLIKKPINSDAFCSLFLNSVSIRESCFSCKFQRLPRQGDITIGDFWGFDNYHKELDDDLGTSLILINTKKGKSLLKILKNNNKLLIKENITNALPRNPNLIKSSSNHPQRKEAFQYFNEGKGISEINDIIINGKCDAIILNYWYAKNYGAILTSFALYEIIKELGYKPNILNYIPSHWKGIYKNSFSQKFAESKFEFTKQCNNYSDLVQLNKCTNNFIVGSDQVWKYDVYSDHDGNIFQLNFTEPDKRRIGCSVSLGSNSLDIPNEEKFYFGSLIKDFNSVSVREQSAQNLLKQNFNVDSDLLMDPVFAYSQSKWIELSGKDRLVNDKYFATFTLSGGWEDNNPGWFYEVNDYFKNRTNLKNHWIKFSDNTTVEEFLNYLCNSQFIVTDSFHAACFSMIFNKPLIYLLHREDLYTRIENIIKRYKVNATIVREKTVLDNHVKIPSANFDYFNQAIDDDAKLLRDWLKDALTKNVKKVDINCRSFLLNYGSMLHLEKENEFYRESSEEWKKMYNSILDSTSWKITKPLRFISRFFK